MPLIVHKCGYSRLPWRVLLLRTEDGVLRTESKATDPDPPSVLSPCTSILELPDSGCRTRHEALALRTQLEAVGDWDTFATWTRAQHEVACAVLATTPMAQHRDAIHRWGRAPWQE